MLTSKTVALFITTLINDNLPIKTPKLLEEKTNKIIFFRKLMTMLLDSPFNLQIYLVFILEHELALKQ